jgi:predicted ester cyclase
MSTPELVRAFYERIWIAGDLSASEQLLAREFRFRGSLGGEMQGRDAFAEYVCSVRSSLGHYHCEILECVAEGSQAFAKMEFSGIHTGNFRGYAPTGKLVKWLGAALFRFREQQIVHLWVLGDLLALEAALSANADSNQ